MKVTRSHPEQLAWINRRVARSDFPSVQEATRQLIDERSE